MYSIERKQSVLLDSPVAHLGLHCVCLLQGNLLPDDQKLNCLIVHLPRQSCLRSMETVDTLAFPSFQPSTATGQSAIVAQPLRTDMSLSPQVLILWNELIALAFHHLTFSSAVLDRLQIRVLAHTDGITLHHAHQVLSFTFYF